MGRMEDVPVPPGPPPPEVAPLEHVGGGDGVQGPVAALAAPLAPLPRHLDEEVVEREVVPDRVLPPLLVLSVIREPFQDVPVDAAQCQPSLGGRRYSHGDEGDVGVRGLLEPGVLLFLSLKQSNTIGQKYVFSLVPLQ